MHKRVYSRIQKEKEVTKMKVCNNCRTSVADNAPYCPNCGASFQNAQQNGYPAYQQPMGGMPKAPVTVGGWIGRSLIPLIPIVGWLVYIIMLFIWTGDATKEDTFRNWAKAQLIVMGVSIALVVLFYVILGASVGLF